MYLGANKIASIPTEPLRTESKIELLILWDNAIQEVGRDMFGGLKSLKNLDIGMNEITSIPGGCFAGLHNLSQLWLTDNNLTTLSADIFTGPGKLY